MTYKSHQGLTDLYRKTTMWCKECGAIFYDGNWVQPRQTKSCTMILEG